VPAVSADKACASVDNHDRARRQPPVTEAGRGPRRGRWIRRVAAWRGGASSSSSSSGKIGTASDRSSSIVSTSTVDRRSRSRCAVGAKGAQVVEVVAREGGLRARGGQVAALPGDVGGRGARPARTAAATAGASVTTRVAVDGRTGGPRSAAGARSGVSSGQAALTCAPRARARADQGPGGWRLGPWDLEESFSTSKVALWYECFRHGCASTLK